jgi:hypothetical protein
MCSFATPVDDTVVVRWQIRNGSNRQVWIPIKFDVTMENKPETELPVLSLVPGKRLMGVAGVFDLLPQTLGMEEGYQRAVLIHVAAGMTATGSISIRLPYGVRGMAPFGASERPNPFTRAYAGYDAKIQEETPSQITTFQMAVQTFDLPEALVDYYKSRYPCGEGHVVVDGEPPLEIVGSLPISGQYWAAALSRVENRDVRIDDCARWIVSPIYVVDWSVGSHAPVGLIDRRGLDMTPDDK